MLDALGNPHRAYESVHVAGTNGKGSTAATVEAAVRSAGRVTGLYTSPHLQTFDERIRVGGRSAGLDLLEACARHVLPIAEAEDASFFEAATVLAFEAFRRAGCDVACVEVGLGGRLDATNVLQPEVTVISSIDLDHAEYLGESLREIAAEKAGILKAGVPAVVGRMAGDALDVVQARAREIGAPLEVLGREFDALDVHVDLDGTRFLYRSSGWADGLRVRTPLVGEYQAWNAAIAIRSLESFRSGADPDSIERGFAGLTWPGRFEHVRATDGDWIFDVAHNPEATRQLAGLLDEMCVSRPLVLLLAVLGDKRWGEMLEPLLRTVAAGVFTIAPSSPVERRWDPVEASRAAGGHRVEVEIDFERAMRRARELAGSGTVVVTGSAHTVGDARARILSED